MKKLLNGIARVLCVMAVCVLAGCSYAGSGGGSTPGGSGNKPVNYTATKKGGLIGTSTQTQGTVIKETWMADNGNLKINETEIAKTSEVVVIPTGTVAKINMTESDTTGDIFTDSRKVKLSPFVISQYEVTRGLFKSVMGETYYRKIHPSKMYGTEDENPINNVNWFDAIVFCNTLSIKLGLEPVYSYYFEKGGAGKMTNPKAWFDDTYNLSATVPESPISENADNWTNEVKIDLSANGYRLPTEAEWEFCARGGDPNAEDWLYPYSGSIDLDKVAWFNKDCTNIVGGMEIANRLGIFDMSGNVWEWINDFYADSVSNDDSKYKEKDSDYIKDPFISSISNMHIMRGGDYMSSEEQLNNNDLNYSRCENFPSSRNQSLCIGFRLVRTIK